MGFQRYSADSSSCKTIILPAQYPINHVTFNPNIVLIQPFDCYLLPQYLIIPLLQSDNDCFPYAVKSWTFLSTTAYKMFSVNSFLKQTT